MSVTSTDGMWFELTPRRLLDSSVPVSRVMTTSAEVAALAGRWPHLPSVSVLTTIREAAHLMATYGSPQVQVRNGRGEIVGVLSASNLFRWVAGDPDDAFSEPSRKASDGDGADASAA
jgi:CBS domain-containing protein